MSVFSIINKNVKVVSRNWSYFIVLVICPVLLVLAAGAMLNSSDPKNLMVGIINEGVYFDVGGDLTNSIIFNGLSSCLYYLTDSRVSACIYSYKDNDIVNIDVYSDNTERRVESYVKQFVLAKVSKTQSEIIEQAGEAIYQEKGYISNSINRSKEELNNAYIEVESLENDLLDNQRKLREQRADFDEMYYSLKNIQANMNIYRGQAEDVRKNIEDFRKKKDELANSIYFARSRLVALGENDLVVKLDIILTELNNIDASLKLLDNALANYDNALVEFDTAMAKLDSIKVLLDESDVNLQNNIEKTRRTKEKIKQFLTEVEEGERRISGFSQNVGLEGIDLIFKSAYNIEEDPVLIAFPLLIAIIVSFTSILLSNLFISKQINHPSFFRDLISPKRDMPFLISNYVVSLFFVFLQVLFLFMVGYFWFNINMLNNYLYSSFLIFLVASIFVFLGMSLGYLIKSQYLSMLISIFLVIFLFIFSNILTPSLLTGEIIQFLININPFVILSNGLKDLIILDKNLSLDSFIFGALYFMYIICFVLYYISKKVGNYEAKK